MIKQFNQEIERIEAQIKADIDRDDALKKRMERLIQVEGIGDVTVLTLFTQLPELGGNSPTKKSWP
jgi:hypothetical protein